MSYNSKSLIKILEKEGWKKGDNGTYSLETKDETIPLVISFSTVIKNERLK